MRELGGLVEALLALAREHQLAVRAHVDVERLGVGQAWGFVYINQFVG